MSRVTFRILGTLEAQVGDQPVRLTGLQSALLAVLLVNADRAVATGRLADGVWGERAPASVSARLRMLIRELRTAFAEAGAGPGLIVTQAPGYRLHLDGAWLDSREFCTAVEEARGAVAADRPADARELYSRALALWRGPALSGVRGPAAEAEASRLAEAHTSTVEACAGVDLALGRRQEAITALTDLVRHHPLRDGPHGQLMLALHRAGRSGEAVEVYRSMRHRYVEELGIEPGPELQSLHQRILRADPALGTSPEPAVAAIRPAQLPPDVSDFTGRDEQIEVAVATLLRVGTTVPVLAVYGKAGVGKSALAVHAAHRIRARFPDGQLHVDLRGEAGRPEHPHDVLARFLGALGLPGAAIPEHPGDRAALYRSRTADQRILIVLDNAADEAQVLPLLPGTAGCAVIITSRAPLAALPGAHRLAVDVLDAEACGGLLEAILGTGRAAAERAEVDLLATLCGRLPLALRVAAGRLAAQPHWLVRTLVDRLADERRRLDELRLGGVEVRASLRLSTAALPEADAAAFALLGLAPAGDFAAWVLAALLGDSVARAQERLDALVRVQLVEYAGHDGTGQARYRLHDLIRAYAAELAGGDHAAAVDRLRGAWLTLTAEAARGLSPRSPAPVSQPARPWPVPGAGGVTDSPAAWLESERRHLVSTVRAATAGGFPWQMASLVSRFLESRGYFDDMRLLHRLGLRAAEEAGDEGAAAAMLCGLAIVDTYQHNLTEARAGHERALLRYRRLRDGWGQAYAEHGLALVLRWTGDIDEALAACGRAVDGYLAAGDELQVAEVRHAAAVVHFERGRWDLAVELAEQALHAYTRAGDRVGECAAWGVLGLAVARQGDPGRAEHHLRAAVDAAGELGLVLDRAYAGRALGDLYVTQGRGARARELFEMGLDVMRTVGDRNGEAGFLRRLARLAAGDGRPDAALAMATLAVEISEPDGAGLYAHSLWALGDVYAATGDQAAATAAWRRSQELFRKLGSTEGPALPDPYGLHTS